MKKCIYLLLLFCDHLLAQPNLVSNPGFELNTSCPNNYNQIWYCQDWSGASGCPSLTDVADYFSGCGTAGYAPPSIGPAWQMPHGGNSYVGITIESNWGNCREYAQNLLADSLIPGVKYQVSFYANLAGKAFFCLAANKLGALFTTYQIPAGFDVQPMNFAHVYTDSIIPDTVGWYYFSESFIADSFYKYMTIGNFFDSANTDVIPLNGNASYAWYLIDDVYVGVDTTLSVPSAGLYSSDTTFCQNQCIDFFDVSTNFPTSWQWFFPGAVTTTSNLQNPVNICYNGYGSYDVMLIACNNAGCDTFALSNFINQVLPAAPPVISFSNDTLFSTPGAAYQWYDVSSGLIVGAVNQFFIPDDGEYYVLVTDSNGCSATSDYVTITGLNTHYATSQSIICRPNPNNGKFVLDFGPALQNKYKTLKIFDALGNTVFESCYGNRTSGEVLNLDLQNGFYYIRVEAEDVFYAARFIVNK